MEGASAEEGASAGACARPPAGSFAPGDTVVLREEEAPCRITFRETDIMRVADPDGARPEEDEQLLPRVGFVEHELVARQEES